MSISTPIEGSGEFVESRRVGLARQVFISDYRRPRLKK